MGDTIEIYNIYDGVLKGAIEEHTKLIVSEIDSVFISKYRKRIILHQICDRSIESIWIEGIGDLQGIFHNSIERSICYNNGIIAKIMGGCSFELQCVYEDGILIYKNKKFNKFIINN